MDSPLQDLASSKSTTIYNNKNDGEEEENIE
jgi:hypothetical protein